MATQEKTWNVANRLHSLKDSDNPEVNHIIAGADEIYDDEKGAKQSEINSQNDAALADRYTKAETYSKEQLDSLITTPDANYVTVATFADLPQTGEADTIYRVSSYDGTQVDASKYALYAWNGATYQLLAVRSAVGEVFDVSEYNSGATYGTLTAALAAVPASVQKGGMSIKFIFRTNTGTEEDPVYHDEYVQYLLKNTAWSIIPSDWESTDGNNTIHINDAQQLTDTQKAQALANMGINGIDDAPTAGSDNLVKSGGVQNELALGAVYDVSAKNPTAGPNNDGKFESLSALLSDANLNTLIPAAVRKPGMSLKFAQSSDNKYVQYRLMANTWSTNIEDWAIADEGVYVENPEFVEVHTDAENKILYGVKTNGDFYFGAGVPEQVQNEIDSETERAEAAEDNKLDKEGLDPGALGTLHAVDNPEYIQVTTDSNNKIIEGITGDGKRVVYIPTYFNNTEIDYTLIKQLKLGLSAQNYIKSLLPNVDNNSNVTLLAHAYHDNFMGFFPFFKEELDDKYWALEQNGFEQFVTRIQGRKTQDVYQIALITDTHQGGAYTPLSYGFRSIALFNKLIPYVDIAMHGGDISVDYGTSKMRLFSYMREVMNLFDLGENKNLLIVRGNHDYNKDTYEEVSPIDVDWDNGIYYTRNVATFTPVTKQTYRGGELYIKNPDYIPDSLFRFIQATNAPVDAVWGDGAYYYYDVESAKIRFVVRSNYPILDDGTISLVEEWKWLAQTALDLSDKTSPMDWSVIVLSHEEATSSPKFTNIANAFINGSSVSVEGVSVNYGTLNGGGISLVHLHGHEHNSAGYSNMSGFLDIGFRAGLTPKVNLGDIAKYNIYVLSIDLANKSFIADNISGESILYDYENNIAKIEIGQTIKMANSGLSSQAAATWTSSDENIATVSDIGNVQGIGSGTATITGVEGNKTVTYTIQVI